eukprot:12452_3
MFGLTRMVIPSSLRALIHEPESNSPAWPMERPPEPRTRTRRTMTLSMLTGASTGTETFSGDFLYSRTVVRNFSKRSVSVGPPLASGWNWTLKKGFLMWIPSLLPSLALTKGFQPSGRDVVSTAKPWFCGVMQFCVRRSMQGWFMPRLPNFILVFAPVARARSFPRQIPKMGLSFSRAFCRFCTVFQAMVGSPGPLLMKRPSQSSP